MDDNKINKNMTTNKQETQPTAQVQKQPDERGSFHLQGHIKIFDPETKEVFVDKRNAIHYENMSEALALSVSNKNSNSANTDPTRNKITVTHTPGLIYTDIIISCLLDYGEPSGQAVFDNSQDLNGQFVFDELGLKGYSSNGEGLGKLLTHVIFSPVQKSLNRLIQIDYTVRIQTLTNLA